MLDSIRKLSALVLLLVMPLQGIAASSLSLLQCTPAEAGAAYPSDRDQGNAQERDDNTADKSHDHVVCHQTISGLPVTPATGLMPDLPVFLSTISLLNGMFLPEQPQRPPFSVSA